MFYLDFCVVNFKIFLLYLINIYLLSQYEISWY